MDYKNIIKTKTILLADDDDSIRETVGSILKMISSRVFLAKNGKEAYTLYEKYKPDIIISDINMPIMNGLEFIKKVREVDNKIPVVMLTAHTDTTYLLDAVKLMLTDYIIKPIELEKLIEVLELCCKYLSEDEKTEILLKNGLTYNFETKELIHNDEHIILGAKEINLLHLLISNPHKTLSRAEIASSVWHNSYVSEGALKTIISKIRNKIGKENIKTIKGMGYKVEIYSAK